MIVRGGALVCVALRGCKTLMVQATGYSDDNKACLCLFGPKMIEAMMMETEVEGGGKEMRLQGNIIDIKEKLIPWINVESVDILDKEQVLADPSSKAVYSKLVGVEL